MSKTANFIDTTIRDGNQSNWAYFMPIGMMKEVIDDIDNAGYERLDLPYHMILFPHYTRALKEDMWEMMRMFGKCKTPKAIMAPVTLDPWQEVWQCPMSMTELFFATLKKYNCLDYAQLHSNTHGTTTFGHDWAIPMFQKMGVKVTQCMCYYNSPRHKRPGYWDNMMEKINRHHVDDYMLKDAGGLLDVDSVREVVSAMQRHNPKDLPIQIHGHGVLGIAAYVYAEAMKLGVRSFCVGTPPLADGTAQPNVFTVAENCRLYGLDVNLDFERIKRISRRIYNMAKQMTPPYKTDFPPRDYSLEPLSHTIPGGVLNTMKGQLSGLKIEDKYDEVIAEVAVVWEELGWPHMITPYSQFVVTQAAINVAMGERYKMVIDAIIKYAFGMYGEDSGYEEMDANLKDKITSLPRAKQLEKLWKENMDITFNKTVKEVRVQCDAGNLSDEDFLMRYMCKGMADMEALEKEIKRRGTRTLTFDPDREPPVEILLKELRDKKI